MAENRVNCNNLMKRISKIFLFSLSVLIISSSFAAEKKIKYHLKFEDCIRLALSRNDQLKALDYDIESSKSQSFRAHPRAFPIINHTLRFAPVPRNIDDTGGSIANGEISPFANFKLDFGIPITTFGKIKTYQELAAVGIEASWFKKYRKRDEIILQIYQIYQGIVLADRLEELAGKGNSALTERIETLEKQDIIDQLQILQLKVARFEVERKLEEAIKKKALAYAALKLQLGLEDKVNVILTERNFHPQNFNLKGEEYYQKKAKEYLPEYKLLEMGIEAKEKQLKIERLDKVPTLGAGGFIDVGRATGITGGEDESTFTNPYNFTKGGFGVELKGKFDYVQQKAKADQAKAELMSAIYQKRAAIRGLEIKLRGAYLDVKQSHSLLEKARSEKKAAQKMVFLTKSNLDIGIGERKDYLDALQSSVLFEGREMEAIYNYNNAISTLKSMTGDFFPEQSNREIY